jgi:hypothetical protein
LVLRSSSLLPNGPLQPTSGGWFRLPRETVPAARGRAASVSRTGANALGLNILLLTALGAAAPQTDARTCTPEAGRLVEQVKGEVANGKTFSKSTRGGWILTLTPIDQGWFLGVTVKGREDEDLSRLTPPWHFVPNARYIEGWHFRNEANTGPNTGSVNAPQRLREFIFSPEVGRTINYDGSATKPGDVEKVEAFGRGWLHLDAFQLTLPRKNETASFVWLKFSACLTWPAG